MFTAACVKPTVGRTAVEEKPCSRSPANDGRRLWRTRRSSNAIPRHPSKVNQRPVVPRIPSLILRYNLTTDFAIRYAGPHTSYPVSDRLHISQSAAPDAHRCAAPLQGARSVATSPSSHTSSADGHATKFNVTLQPFQSPPNALDHRRPAHLRTPILPSAGGPTKLPAAPSPKAEQASEQARASSPSEP